MDEDSGLPDIVVHPIGDSIDLHTFQPSEVASVTEEYLRECFERGYSEVRIVHGKGTGTLREVVHGVLRRSPYVSAFRLAPCEAGGWGATMVELRRRA